MGITQSLVAFATLAVVSGCSAASAPQLSISGHYGTVAYSGVVSREETPSTYIFVLRELQLTFLPNAKVNSVTSIVNPQLRLVTTYLAPSSTRAVRTSEAATVLHVTLDRNHQTARVRDLRFVVDKAKVANSTRTIFDLTDGRLVWPFTSQLKP